MFYLSLARLKIALFQDQQVIVIDLRVKPWNNNYNSTCLHSINKLVLSRLRAYDNL